VNWTSRASSATYYDVNGTLKKSSYNLLTYSEDFTNAIWPTSSTATITASTGVDDPQGTNNAATVENISGPNLHRLITGTAGLSYTYSIWIRRRSGSGPIYLTVGDAINQQVTVTNDWTRVSVTNIPTSNIVRAYVVIGSTGDSVDLWGAQLETGTTAGDYAKTTTTAASTARTAAYLPDGSGNFVSAGPLLLEDAGTNLLLQSEDFSTTWGLANMRAFGSGSTVNAVIAPDGTLTADHIVEDTSTGNHNIGQSAPVVSGSVCSISVYAKAPAQSRQLQILVANTNFTVTPLAIFDASTGSVVSSANGTASIVPFGNGWYRCQFTTISATSSGNNGFNFRFHNGATNSYTGDDTSGLYLWGAQLEANSYPTSYIPTSGSTATRAADVSTSAATTVFESDWYRQDEGTIYHLYKPFGAASGRRVFSLDDGTSDNQYRGAASNGSGTAANYIEITSGGVNQGFLGTGNAYTETQQSGAFAYIVNNAGFSKNGSTALLDSSVSIPTINTLNIGSDSNNTSALNGTIRRLCYWRSRLPDSTLQTITQ